MASCRPHATSLELGSGRASLRRGNRPPPHKLEAIRLEARIFAERGHAPTAPEEPSQCALSSGQVPATHGTPVPLSPNTGRKAKERLGVGR